ncbi:MAG: hypothetical protein GY869_21190, partial [Planctomycetes bacterium]|nr:hypothetical protein [Planctomycetota bacterium]
WNNPDRPEDERYPAELHPIFLRLMERFDLSYRVMLPVDGQITEPPATSLIAQLVPGDRPDNLATYWESEPEAGDVERTQVCRIVDAQTGDSARAPGLIYRLIVRLHRYSMGRNNYRESCHWQGGLLLDDHYNGRVLLEELGDDIRITVRAAYPGFLLFLLSQEVKWLVENFWKGLLCQIMVPCQKPCGMSDPGRGLFEVNKLIESRRRGREEYPCPIPDCEEWPKIDNLLANVTTPPQLDVLTFIDERL